MSWRPDEPPVEDEPLGRPFLHGPPGGRPQVAPPSHRAPSPHPGYGSPPPPRADAAPPPVDEVRPYLLTGGRTRARGADVAMETVVLATGATSTRGGDAAGLERARIVRLAERPCSPAEIAARLHLPLQVALVLVTDLVAEGLLDATAVGTGQSDDVLFLERLIAGVAAL